MKNTVLAIFVAVLIPLVSFAQMDTVLVHSDVYPNEGNLNNAVQACIQAGTLSHTVFKLDPGGHYVLTGTIITPAHSHLYIVGPDPGRSQATALPQIEWSSNQGVTTTFSFDCFGDITMKNIWILCATTNGAQTGSNIVIENDTAANLSGKGEIAEFDGCIFDYQGIGNSGGAIEPACTHFRGKFTNSYFRNCTDPHYRYYGRAVSWTYQSTIWHTDSISFENCTFANLGYVFSQEAPEYSDYVSFNHCTFTNSMMFSLESGYWHWLSVSNSIFVNMFMFGDIISQRGFQSPSNAPYGGTIYIDSVSKFGFSVPFTEADRHILFMNNSYAVEPWLVDFYAHNSFSDGVSAENKPMPQPMMNQQTKSFFSNKLSWPYMAMANLYDSADPGFIVAPTNRVGIEAFLIGRWSTGANVNWANNVTNDIMGIWPIQEDLSYTNDTLKTAGMGGFPLGDLYHWWPAQYAPWNMQAETEHQNIFNMLNGSFNTAVLAPILDSPSANAQNQRFDTLVMAWNAVPLASGYECQVSLTPSFSTLAAQDSTADTTLTITSLRHFTSYYWRVRALGSGGAGAFSAVRVFMTIPVIPAAPTLISPSSNAVNQPSKIKLICSKAADAVFYHWQVSTDVGFSNPAANDSSTDTTHTVGPLTAGTTYYWRVRGVNSLGPGSFTNIDTFSVMASPAVPVLGQRFPNADSVILNWFSALGASGYECQLSLSSSFTTLVTTKDSTADTTFRVRSLQYAKKYYWRVRAFNIGGASAFAAADSFTTVVEVPAPPQLVSPRSITNVGRRTTFVLRSSTTALQYRYQVAADSLFNVVVRDTITVDTSVTLSTSLAANIRYFWRASAINIGGEGSCSMFAYFTTGISDNVNGDSSEIPKEFALMQNYPNPFNPSTTIRYQIPTTSMITIKIYNLLGQEIATLVDGQRTAGSYSVEWNTENVPSGVYIYRTEAVSESKRFEDVKKMVLLK